MKFVPAIRIPAPWPGQTRRARWSRYPFLRDRCARLLLLALSFLSAVPLRAASQSLLGKVVPVPNTVAEIYSPATGRIISAREHPYMAGDRVQKGDPLAIIEHRYTVHDASHIGTIRWDLISVMLDARRVATQARVEREKAERLLRLGTISGQQVQALRAAELVAKAEYDKRRTLLNYQDSEIQGADPKRRPLLAPIAGEISFASFSQGQLINEGVLLYRVVDRSAVWVAAQVPETGFRAWPEKAVARIRFDSLPGKTFLGHLQVTSPVVDPQSRTREVNFRVENPEGYLRYGMIGQVELTSP